MIRTVFFDLGGTLVHYGKREGAEDLNAAGLKNVYDLLKQKTGVLPPFEAFSKRMARALKLGWVRQKITSRELDAPAVVKKTLAKMKIFPSESELAEIAQLWYQPFSESCALLPDAKEVLSALKARTITMGIISNTLWKGHFLMEDLRRLGVLDFFDILVFSSQTTIRKPAGVLFEHACKHTGHSRLDCMMVGDNLEDDVFGAINAGMSAVLIGKRFRKPGKNMPFYEIEKLPQLLEIIDELNSAEQK